MEVVCEQRKVCVIQDREVKTRSLFSIVSHVLTTCNVTLSIREPHHQSTERLAYTSTKFSQHLEESTDSPAHLVSERSLIAVGYCTSMRYHLRGFPRPITDLEHMTPQGRLSRTAISNPFGSINGIMPTAFWQDYLAFQRCLQTYVSHRNAFLRREQS